MNLNLRKCEDGWRAVGLPRGSAAAQGEPVLKAGGSLFCVSAAGLEVTTPQGARQTLATEKDVVVTALSDSAVALFRADDPGRMPEILEFDADSGRWARSRGSGPLMMPSLTAQSVAVLRGTLPARSLRGSYRGPVNGLTSEDTATLTRDYITVYDALSAEALAAGAYIEPVVARSVLLDAGGAVVAVSPPVVLGAGEAVSVGTVERDVTLDGADFTDVAATDVTVTAWRVKVEWPAVPDAEWRARVARVGILVSPPVSSLRRAGFSMTRMTRDSATEMTLHQSLPGVGFDGKYPARTREEILTLATGGFDGAHYRVLRPGADGAMETVLAGGAAGRDVPDPRKCVRRFAAGASCLNGMVRVWGDITEGGTPLPWPNAWASATDNAMWSGSVMAAMRGTPGRTAPEAEASVVATAGGLHCRPTALSPLIVVDDPRATTVRIAVGTDNVTLPLQPSPDGLSAFYLAPDLQPVRFSAGTTALVPAANTPLPVRHENGLIIADASAPMTPLCHAATPDGTRITAILPASRSRSSWDFGRAHFIVLTTGGIYALAVNAARTRAELSLLDRRVAAGACLTPGGVIAASGPALIKIAGAGVEHFATLDEPVAAVGYDPHHRELWAVHYNSHGVTVIPEGSTPSYRRDLPVRHILAAGEGFLATTADAVFTIDGREEEPAGGMPIKAVVQLKCRPRRIVWDFNAAGFTGELRLECDGGSDDARRAVIAAYKVDGAVNEPVVTTVIAPRRRRYFAVIEGNAIECKIRM